jgi:hypothetical protein
MALALALTLGAWLLPVAVAADSKLATLNVKGMVCQA